MEMPCRNRVGYAPTALALGLIVCSPLPASAQMADRHALTEAAISSNTDDMDSARSRAADLSIATHDVSGRLGAALPLKIKLVRTRRVAIEAIHLLGLPRGVTISDSINTFSPSDDKRDVDISAWDLSNIQITQSDERENSFALAVAAVWTPEAGGQTDVATSLLNVHFVPDRPDRTVAARGDEPRGPGAPVLQLLGTAPDPQAPADAASRDAPDSDVYVPEVARLAPLESTPVVDRPASPTVTDRTSAAEAATPLRPAATARPAVQKDPLVERAKGLIRLGDISGARLLLERAQARNAPDATFLLAQTWDPAMLRSWKVRGLRSDPDLARSLYAKAASQLQQPDERQLAATSR